MRSQRDVGNEIHGLGGSRLATKDLDPRFLAPKQSLRASSFSGRVSWRLHGECNSKIFLDNGLSGLYIQERNLFFAIIEVGVAPSAP